jgi:hypothetical protein
MHFLQSWPISSQKATRNDYARMSSVTQINLDFESMKRLHAAIMKAYFKVAGLNGEFPVVLQDHITGASVQITLNSHNCQILVKKAELFDIILQTLNLPSLNQQLQCPLPRSSNMPPWWDNEVDFALLRVIFSLGFIDWRKARQDPSFGLKIGLVIDHGISESFIIDRMRTVCQYLLSPPPPPTILTTAATIPPVEDPDVIEIDPPPLPQVTKPAAIKPAAFRSVLPLRQEGDSKPEKSLFPPLGVKQVPLKQSNVLAYFNPQPKS